MLSFSVDDVICTVETVETVVCEGLDGLEVGLDGLEISVSCGGFDAVSGDLDVVGSSGLTLVLKFLHSPVMSVSYMLHVIFMQPNLSHFIVVHV